MSKHYVSKLVTKYPGIRAIPSVGNTTTDGGVNSAILRYDGAPVSEPNSTAITNGTALNEANVIVSTRNNEGGELCLIFLGSRSATLEQYVSGHPTFRLFSYLCTARKA